MLGLVSQYRDGNLGLGELAEGLRGLFVEADPHDVATRDAFETKWLPIDLENELRTGPWAPVGAASDENLSDRLEEFCAWVNSVINLDQTNEHR